MNLFFFPLSLKYVEYYDMFKATETKIKLHCIFKKNT